MPIYEFRCEDCQSTFEVLTAYAERDRGQACPHCESPHTRVLVSSFAPIGAGETAAAMPAASGGCGCGGACACSTKQ